MKGDGVLLNSLKDRRSAHIAALERERAAIVAINAVIALIIESPEGDMSIAEVEEHNRYMASQRERES